MQTLENNHNQPDAIYTQFGKFYVGQAVTYSVYPLIWEGLGMATDRGIVTVGQTYGDYILDKVGEEKVSDICEWEIVYDAKPRLIGIHGTD